MNWIKNSTAQLNVTNELSLLYVSVCSVANFKMQCHMLLHSWVCAPIADCNVNTPEKINILISLNDFIIIVRRSRVCVCVCSVARSLRTNRFHYSLLFYIIHNCLVLERRLRHFAWSRVCGWMSDYSFIIIMFSMERFEWIWHIYKSFCFLTGAVQWQLISSRAYLLLFLRHQLGARARWKHEMWRKQLIS